MKRLAPGGGPAPAPRSPATSTGAVPLLVFELDEQPYALPVQRVREVLPRASVIPLPGAPPGLLGVLRLRGTLLPVVDLRQRLGLDLVAPRIGQCIIAAEFGISIGLLADGVQGVVIANCVDTASARAPGQLVAEVTMASGQVMTVLDADAAVGAEIEKFVSTAIDHGARGPANLSYVAPRVDAEA